MPSRTQPNPRNLSLRRIGLLRLHNRNLETNTLHTRTRLLRKSGRNRLTCLLGLAASLANLVEGGEALLVGGGGADDGKGLAGRGGEDGGGLREDGGPDGGKRERKGAEGEHDGGGGGE